MRIMIKFTFPVDAGNDAIRSRKLEKVFKQIAEEPKPEAAYFSHRAASGEASSRGYDCVVADCGDGRTIFLRIKREGGDGAGDGPGRPPARIVQH